MTTPTAIASIQDPITGNAILTAWGDGVNSWLLYLATTKPHCTVSNSTTQSVNNTTETDLTANTETSDIGGMHSTVSNTDRITIPSGEGGLYRVTPTVEFPANGTGTRIVRIRKNNTTDYNVGATPGQAGGATIVTGSRSLVLAAGDYVTCRVYQSSGGALAVQLLDFAVMWEATA